MFERMGICGSCLGAKMLEVLSKQNNLSQIKFPTLRTLSSSIWPIFRKAQTREYFQRSSPRTGLSASALHHLHRFIPHLLTFLLDLRCIVFTCIPSPLNLAIDSQLSKLSIMFPAHPQIYGDQATHLIQICSPLSCLSIG